jgi:uncharacterized protein
MSSSSLPSALPATLEPVEAKPAFAPTPKTQRIASIDFVRGMALLGILFVNVGVMFGPLAVLFEPAVIAGMAAHDRVALLLVMSLCQGKFISQFSMLFGYGLLGQIEKAAAAGRSPFWFTFRRLGTLAIFGLIHGLAIWFGDILLTYACIGPWLLLARGASARALGITAAILLAVTATVHVGVAVLPALGEPRTVKAMRIEPATPQDPHGYKAMIEAQFNPSHPLWIRAEVSAYSEGPWQDAQAFRGVEWIFAWLAVVWFTGWQVLAMFFVGAVLWRVQFFSPAQEALRRRVLLVCLPLGAAIEGAAAWLYWTDALADRRAWAVAEALQGFAVCFLPLGYLAGLALLADRLPATLRGLVASAGRMALTVYLLESLIAAFLSYHWGLGLFGHIGNLAQVLLAVAIWSFLVLFSAVYLRFFDQGPMERLWRLLGYGRAGKA